MSRAVTFFLLVVASGLSLILALLGLETLSKNLLGWVLLAVGIAYPAGAIIFYWLQKRPFWMAEGRAIKGESGDRSFWAILPGMLVSFFASPLEYIYLEWLPALFWMQVLGLMAVTAGLWVYAWARRTIKGMYSSRVEVTSQHVLTTLGPYHYVRHPGYAGFFLMAMGISLGFGSLIGMAAIPLLLMPGLAYRIRVEDDLLQDYFGEDFVAYARRVKKLIPGIW